MSEREGEEEEEEEEEEEGRRVFDHDGGSLQTWGPPASQDRQKNLLQNKRERNVVEGKPDRFTEEEILSNDIRFICI